MLPHRWTQRTGVTIAAVAAGSMTLLTGCGAIDQGTPTASTAHLQSAVPTSRIASQEPPMALVAPTPAPTTAVAPAPPRGPATSFGGDGTYLVGTDIVAGTYRSTGPSVDGVPCYWERVRDLSGNSIIANDLSNGPSLVTVQPGDAALEVAHCTGWTLVPGPPVVSGGTAPSPAAGSSPDEYFRSILRAANVYFPSDAAALSEGHRACAMYSTGSDNVAVAKQITQDLPDLTHDDALAVERAATQAYCTQFS